jgi:hypothetical protein
MLRVIVLFLIQINKNYETNQQRYWVQCISFSCFLQQMDYSKAIPFDSTVKTGKRK